MERCACPRTPTCISQSEILQVTDSPYLLQRATTPGVLEPGETENKAVYRDPALRGFRHDLSVGTLGGANGFKKILDLRKISNFQIQFQNLDFNYDPDKSGMLWKVK